MKKLFRKLFPSKEMRAYRKMHRRHKRELVKLAKETREWDYSWMHDMVIMQIRHMHEYYSAGNNVWQTEETLNPIVAELKHVLNLDEEMDNLWSNHVCSVIENKDGSVTVNNQGAQKYIDVRTKETELYKEIYSYIGEHLQGWWD